MKKAGNTILTYAVGCALLAAIILANVAVLFRYTLELPIIWSEEFLRYLFIWVIFIGASLSYGKGDLVDISLVTDLLKGKMAIFMDALRHFLSFLFALIVGYQGFIIMNDQIISNELSIALELPIWLITFSLVIANALWVIFAVKNMYNSLNPLFDKSHNAMKEMSQ